ncbi:MAG: tetratricopeptide repeat protein, partial [Acidobacteriota bacterium]
MDSQTIGSSELGNLFEQATLKILEQMFRHWGCEPLDTRVQRAGSQHGFDVFYRVAADNVHLNIFVECKASQTYNTIKATELVQKVHQLSWAGFPAKDIHLFFSPSRTVEFDNQTLTIEDDSHPFVVIDWMRKLGGINPAMELFAAYRNWGDDEDILNYCSHLFSQVDPEVVSVKTFEEVCAQLRTSFSARLAEHSAGSRLKNYRIINGAFWKQIREETQSEYLHYYYTRVDSTPVRLREAVANESPVRNEALEKEFERTLNQAVRSRAGLIKILSKGGEGKSTFLYQLAKTYCHDYLVVWLESIETNVLLQIERQALRSLEARPLLFLLDNAATFDRPLVELSQALTAGFRARSFVLVLAERDFRYRNIEDLSAFEASFNETYVIEYSAHRIREKVCDKLVSNLKSENLTAAHEIADLFLDDNRKSLSERIISVLSHLRATNQLIGYKFDWEDWERFTSIKSPALGRLYLILATFYQFGFSVDIEFCTKFLNDADAIEIKTVLSNNPNLPIYRRSERLLLRHETIASWYLDGMTPNTLVNRENSEEIFQEFLRNIDSPASRDLFIWLCIKNRDFRSSYLAKYVTDQKRAEILAKFIDNYPAELKSRTELSKIYQRQRKWDDATRLLKEYIELDPDGLHPRTELSKIYQRQKKWDDATRLLKEYIELDPDGLHPRTELSK